MNLIVGAFVEFERVSFAEGVQGAELRPNHDGNL